MFGWGQRAWRQKNTGPTPETDHKNAEPQENLAQPILLRLVGHLANSVSKVGKNAAEVRGVLEDTQKVVESQAQCMAALSIDLAEVRNAQQAISAATSQTGGAVVRARQALENIGQEVGEIVQTLSQVSDAASQITRIALQTRLVAFNASVEAKRAGDAGRSFGVVADAVKDLAAQVELSSKSIMGTVAALDARVNAFSRELVAADSSQVKKSVIHQAFADVESDVARIEKSAQNSDSTSLSLAECVNALAVEVQTAKRNLSESLACSDRLLTMSEELIEEIAESGVEVDDALFIRAAQDAAATIAQQLEAALRSSKITPPQLFDQNYQPIPGTEPPQFQTQFVPLADRLLPPIQEPVLALDKRIVFCIAVDHNGYVPVHNNQYCQPQRPGDVVWNTANSRYRRIFNDRTGLASARNERPFLLQTYRRDMGGGRFVLLKEVSAPIMVAGRHWGGVRLAFSF
ncbi:methyl-accepting chemotaxis protein [Roseateles koreensis]|uniref:Methyl-accepting chemotaxis protein n=1 Tax=Roseateles koreensis TaxID=2987526 RepID=A0ABT5KMY5_9BURK|nr:methyl-accepting chemotaxis protein [Roseateles koreensis]MDC8784278.1 methyl-accepting chemotaxis protein [Roseateles koreensis]